MIFYITLCGCKLALYSDVIYSFDWKSAINTMVVLKMQCVIVYLARDIPAFVLYCVYGGSRSSLRIEFMMRDRYT